MRNETQENNQEEVRHNFFYDVLFYFALFGLLLTFSYFVSVLDAWRIMVSFFGTIIFWFIFAEKRKLKFIFSLKQLDLNQRFLFFVILLGDLTMLIMMFAGRTTGILTSPWLALPPIFFLLFGLTSWALYVFSYGNKSKSVIWLTTLHFFVAFSVSAIIFKLGFGFDPFIHRASEQALLNTGLVLPKTILYAGQYVMVTALAFISPLSIQQIDVWFVPIIASVFLSRSFYIGLKSWGIPKRFAGAFLQIILIFPFLPLTFTVPNNIALVLFLTVIFLLKQSDKDKYLRTTLLLLSSYAVVIHPLIGVPTLIIYVGYTLKNWFITLIISSISLPAMFAFYNFQKGEKLFQRVQIWKNKSLFLDLFRDPFSGELAKAPQYLNAIYFYRQWISLTLFFVVVVFLLVLLIKRQKSASIFLSFYIGTTVAIFFLSTMFVFKNIINFEQQEFAFRVIQAIYLSTSLFLSLMLYKIFTKSHFIVVHLSFVILSAFSVMSLYLSYPQTNLKSWNSGPSMSQIDIDIVHEIDKISTGEYFVLSSQMTSAASLQEFGFDQMIESDEGDILRYAIPTGGRLYQYFLKMINTMPKREIMKKAAEFANVDEGFFVIYRSWGFGDDYVNIAINEADSYSQLGTDAVNNVVLLYYKF